MSTLETKIPNLDTQKRIASALETIAGGGLKEWNLETNHPVGTTWESIYPVNPADILGGGTWKQLKDVTIVAAGDTFKVSDINTNQDGGEATHTLTIDEMPSHSHTAGSYDGFKIKNDSFQTSDGSVPHNVIGVINGGKNNYESGLSTDLKTNTTGGGQSHNNMQPYKVLYKWIRTA